MGLTWKLALGLLLGEALLILAAASSVYARPPIRRRPVPVVWLRWHVLPVWVCWRALWGWVLRRAGDAAVRACVRHERAQATATFPAAKPGS